MAVGLGLGVSATAMAEVISSVSERGYMSGGLSGPGGGGISVRLGENDYIKFATESWSSGNPYVIPKWEFGTDLVTPTRLADEDKMGELVITAEFPEGIKIVDGAFKAFVYLGQGKVKKDLVAVNAAPAQPFARGKQLVKLDDNKVTTLQDIAQRWSDYCAAMNVTTPPTGLTPPPAYNGLPAGNEIVANVNDLVFKGIAVTDIVNTGLNQTCRQGTGTNNWPAGAGLNFYNSTSMTSNWFTEPPSGSDWKEEGAFYAFYAADASNVPGTPVSVVEDSPTQHPEPKEITGTDFTKVKTNDTTMTFTIKEGAILRELEAGAGGTLLSGNYTVWIYGEDFSFNDPNGLLSTPGLLRASLTFAGSGADAPDAATVSAVIAQATPGLGDSTIKGGAAYTSTVDAKSVMTEFVRAGGTTAKRAHNADLELADLTGSSTNPIMTQNGKMPFGDQELKVKFTFGAKGGAELPESVGDIWLDLDGNGEFDAAKDALLTANEEGVMSATFDWGPYKGDTIPLYVNVSEDVTSEGDEPLFLPYFQEFEASLTIVDDNDVVYTNSGVSTAAAGTWDFNGTVLSVPRFDIKGAGGKCTLSIANTSDNEIDYLTYFIGAKNLKSGEVPVPTALGDNAKGKVPANSSVNIPCNTIVKKVKGNQGALEIVVMERPGFITGATQTIKGSGLSVSPMTYKWNILNQ